ncbi:hypothetical protein GCM10023206_00950 [Acinetobacter puyangensis]|uniref:Uncharacterized protein n=1 Tax=Acinetobacter puyangensis TaxID=1096779 RepID=A0A240E9G7_9GAMM|nr:prepilin-type N-terminal cleavage/methylation domain-containing protein [Acinetobacter puyangensis]SNX44555.1 hypothetical protein SAMN05421731_103293 [Acinetobacter puyangensis]
MNKQKGVTLISLLIGLLIAMLCMVAVLSIYRTVVYVGADSRIAATHDTQLQNGLTTAQMLLQNAGFGLDPTVRNVATTSISLNSTTINALVWKELDAIGGTAHCYGLADIAVSAERQLVLLKGTGCQSSGTVTYNVTAWSVERTLAHLHDYSADKTNLAQIGFSGATASTTTDKACTPYGEGEINTVKHPNVTISAKTSTNQTVNITVCLVNIVVA